VATKNLDPDLLRQAHADDLDLNTLINDALLAERDVTLYLRGKGRSKIEETDLPNIIRTVPRALDSLRVRRALSFVRSRHLTKKRRPKDTALLLAIFRAIQKIQFRPKDFAAMQRHGAKREREKAADLYLAERDKGTSSEIAARRAMRREPFAFKKPGTLRVFASRRAEERLHSKAEN
jgi:hypothetical protein